MPRIKAITTGTIPGFIDVILNVDSKELHEDNLVEQMKKSNKRIIFFGDDTWIKLFPNYFQRQDGTTSFFVSDYTEVDNNVTRHIVPEMDKQDWDVMILHYLGLDHIGHLAGPCSPLVRPKLVEMDQIIEKIYKATVRQDLGHNITTLLVLCGDHGMSDGGSHGGSSFAETTTPLVFMSSSFEQGQGELYNMKRVNQIDIAPTLAVLFGLSIPKNSIGIVIPDLLARYSVKERLDAIRMNALQISDVYQSNTDNESVVDLDLAERLHNEWLNEYESHIGIDVDARAETISKLYYSGMQTMTEKLTKFMSSYDFYALHIGIWFLLQSLLGSVGLFVGIFSQDFSSFFRAHVCSLLATFFVIACFITLVHVLLCSTPQLGTSEVFCAPSFSSLLLSFIFILSTAISTLLGIVFVFHNVINCGFPSWIRTSTNGNSKTLTFLIFGMLLHNISLLSTSFIEEEHQSWYFLTTSYHLIVFYEIYIKERRIFPSIFSREESSEDVSLHNKRPSTSDLTTDTIKDLKLTKYEDQNIPRTSSYIFILLLCDRIVRSWNQTGIKWADQPDVGDWLVSPENKTPLTLLTVIFLVGITLNIFYRKGQNKCDFFTFAIFTSGVMSVYLYRAATDCVDFSQWIIKTSQTGIEFAQITQLCVVLLVLMSLFQFMYSWKGKRFSTQKSPVEVFVTGYLLLIMLLLRTHNIPLVAIMLLQVHVHREVVWKRCESDTEIILSAYYIGWFTYFSQGNSNSFATVDIGAGYIGLGKNYWPAVVGLQTSLATFSGPLFWIIQAVIFIQSRQNTSNRSSSRGGVGQLCTILLMIKSFNLTVCTILSWLNCYHLFVWSVFSPKLLYEGVVSLLFCIVILTVSVFIKIEN
ncbi:GPI ethanolamine phosphate transferase 2-like [Dendronephthya gigantea]|uniref:GPI ethanolamine phosphate transferase 2-like n=1 Tax=Dendronephthya gigantea TaxID=151771 RepID=UPI00106B949B|nr:GPI ethanolamine phosphate transferase 2-like [Dendronephthya gigantea]